MNCTGYCHCGRQPCPHPERCQDDRPNGAQSIIRIAWTSILVCIISTVVALVVLAGIAFWRFA